MIADFLSLFAIVLGVLLCIVGAGMLGVEIGEHLGFPRGVAEGRRLEAMEPPTHGVMNFRDGHVRQIYAASAEDAIDRVIQMAGGSR